MKPDIYKAAGVLIRNRKLLMVKSKKSDIFLSPGGKIEVGETPEQALVRELQEEIGLAITLNDLEKLMSAEAMTAEMPPRRIKMEVFRVGSWLGEPVPQAEIEALEWVNSSSNPDRLGSAFAHQVIPFLKEKNLID